MTKMRKNPIMLISLEVSNSWNKLCTGGDPFLIPAGFQRDPSRNALRDDHNPVVVSKTGESLWFGEYACAGKHVDPSNLTKPDRARLALMSCARPEMNDQQIRIVASHWDVDQFEAMRSSLLGHYSFHRNGVPYNFEVVDVKMLLEGFGTFFLHNEKAPIKECITVEIGYATVEYLYIKDGCVTDAWVSNEFPIKVLCDRIAANHKLQVKNRSTSPNLEAINRDLRNPTHGSLTPDEWGCIKSQYVKDFFLEFCSSLEYDLNDYASVEKIILTGGGAALFASIMSKQFAIDYSVSTNAQTASLEGAYLWGLKQGY